jgi:hypothetical protein
MKRYIQPEFLIGMNPNHLGPCLWHGMPATVSQGCDASAELLDRNGDIMEISWTIYGQSLLLAKNVASGYD